MSDNLYNMVDKVHFDINMHKQLKRPQTFSRGGQKVVGGQGRRGAGGQKDTICLNKCYGINLGIKDYSGYLPYIQT